MVSHKKDHDVFDGCNYDGLIGGIIPHYQILLRTAVHYLQPHAKNILELGCGTGVLTGLIHEACPRAEITGIDLSNEMLDKARTKPSLRKIRFVAGDIRNPWTGDHYDAIITTLCLHHLADHEREDLFKRASKALEPDGRFICGDIFRADRDRDNTLIVEAWRDSMIQGNVSADDITAMITQYANNLSQISTLPMYCEQLKKAGFSCTFSPFAAGLVGLVIGFRSDKDPMLEPAALGYSR
jgi:tRNA (cmo5U34)-methyltransferase